jgi:hypothetical protein
MSSCADPSLSQCNQAGFPSNFCCKTGENCISLAGNTTILCCPDGNDCTLIVNISCNIALQNVSSNPDASVKTTFLSGSLPKCGDQCCPFGYACDQDGNCSKDSDQSQKPTLLSVPSGDVTTTEPTSTTSTVIQSGGTQQISTVTTSATNSGSLQPPATTTSATEMNGLGNSTSTSAPSGPSSTPPFSAASSTDITTRIVAGILGGVLALLLIGAVIFWFWRKRTLGLTVQRRASQRRFEKAELSAGGELRKMSMRYELSSDTEPVELPATPLRRSRILSFMQWPKQR